MACEFISELMAIIYPGEVVGNIRCGEAEATIEAHRPGARGAPTARERVNCLTAATALNLPPEPFTVGPRFGRHGHPLRDPECRAGEAGLRFGEVGGEVGPLGVVEGHLRFRGPG